jgi:hypothetical protein
VADTTSLDSLTATLTGQLSVVSTSESDKPEVKDRRAKIEKFLGTARTRFKIVVEAESELRADQLEDLEFVSSEQWPGDIQNQRSLEGRPCLTINRLPQFIRQVTNQQRASRPAIQVNPKGGGATLKTAQILQGLVRDIELQSDADVAYITGADYQAKIGRGFWRVVTEYAEDPNSFDQVIRIRRIRNPFTVYMDPGIQRVDAGDAKYCFIVEDLTKEEFQARFGDDTASLTEFASIGDQAPVWLPNGGIRIAEYWYTEDETETLLDIEVLPNPSIPDDMGSRFKVIESAIDLKALPPHRIVNSRERKVTKVYMALINGVSVLTGNKDKTAGTEWPGQWIPIIPVIGEEIDLNGRVDYRGMVRDAREPQRAYNFWISCATEAVALAPKAPWVMAAGQDEGFETMWDQANVKNFSRLIYKPVTLNDQLAPPPTRQTLEPAIQAIVTLIRQADNDLKATMGFYDASLGNSGPEQSGKAILARQKQGEIGNSNYLDNLGRAIRQTGRVVVNLIPKVLERAQVVRIVGHDDKPKLVQHAPGGVLPEGTELPEDVAEGDIYDLTHGEYDVSISTGTSWESKRQEAVAQMGELIKSNPALAQVIGDLWVGNMDSPWAQEAAKRLKKAIPPNLLDPEEGGQAPIPPEVQQQLEQLGQQVQQLSMALEEAQKTIDAKKEQMAAQTQIAQIDSQAQIQRAQIDAQARATIEAERTRGELQQEQIKGENDRVVAEIKAASAAQIAEMKAESAKQLEAYKAHNAAMLTRMEHAFGARNDQEDAMRANIAADNDDQQRLSERTSPEKKD